MSLGVVEEPVRAGVDEDLARARTLPGSWYRDPAIFAAERRGLFPSTWQYVAHLDQLPRPGSYVEAQVQGEPLIILKDGDGRVRALSNVCRHRAGPMVSGTGHCRTLQCRYHGWTYELDGRLRRAPEFEGVLDFDPASVRLPEARAAVWGPFVFVNLDPAAPSLEEFLGEIPGEVRERSIDLEKFRFIYRKDYLVRCNWKTYVDNYLEGYHIPLVHPSLFKEIDYHQYRVESRGFNSRQIAPLRRSESQDRRYGPGDPEPLYYWLFPNYMVNIYPDNLSVNLVVPLDPETTLTVFEWYVVEGSPLLEGYDPGPTFPVQLKKPIPSLLEDRPMPDGIRDTVSFSDIVQREDIEICEAVQVNLGSRTYDQGRYSVRREAGVHHFHRLVERHVEGGARANPH